MKRSLQNSPRSMRSARARSSSLTLRIALPVAIPVALFGAILLALPGCKYLTGQIVESSAVRYVLRWASGTVQKEGSLTDGLQSGEWTYYYEDGKRRAKGPYENDHQIGEWTYWYENGNVEWVGQFDEEGHRTGPGTYYYQDGKKRAQGRFSEDAEAGTWTFWHPSGEIARRGDYSGGRTAGYWEYFYADGKPKKDGIMHNGQMVGVWNFRDENGKLTAKNYPLPAGCALVRETWEDGSPRRVGVLENGRPVGRWTCWHESGARRICCDVADGKATGAFCAMRGDGKPLAEGVLVNSEMTDVVAFDDEGTKPVGRAPLPQVPPAEDEWSDPDIVDNEPVERVIAQWFAELTAPVPTPEPPKPVEAPAPTAEQAAPEPDKRVTPPVQPDLTVLEKKELDNTVLRYEEGEAAARPPKRRYGPRKSTGGAKAERRRRDLEGKEMVKKKFTCSTGEVVDLDTYKGKKNVLVVVLRGFKGQVCVYCMAQTKALSKARKALGERDVEVLVVYPGVIEGETTFKEAYERTFKEKRPPYSVFHDPTLDLVKRLKADGGDDAYPTSIILDKKGIVRYAYTGLDRADRPPVKELLKVIDGLNK